MYPAALMAITRMTRIQIEWGFIAANGPIGRSGTSGRTTSVAPAKIKASLSSSSVSTERAKRCSLDRAASRIAMRTARPAASAGCCIERPPSRVVRISAISVVRPGSPSCPRQYAAAVNTTMPPVITASNTSPPTMKLTAPASEVTANVLIPAGERDGPPFYVAPVRRQLIGRSQVLPRG